MTAEYTGKQIMQRRKELGLTQKALSEKLGITDKAVSKWERGLNFPDLGLIEDLARVLDTTPVILLGLENANQVEIVDSMAQLSGEQVEDARRTTGLTGWFCLLAAIALVIAHSLFGGKSVREIQIAYQILQFVITVAIIGGIWLLFRFGEIRTWTLGDWLIFYGALSPVLIWNGIYFITGYSPYNWLTTVLVMIGSILTQLLFYRIIRSKPIKALPLFLSIGCTIWMIGCENSFTNALVAIVCCLIVYLGGVFQHKLEAIFRRNKKTGK